MSGFKIERTLLHDARPGGQTGLPPYEPKQMPRPKEKSRPLRKPRDDRRDEDGRGER